MTGNNTFEIERALSTTIANFSGTAERIDGSELELKQLPDLLMGATLFADKRLVIIKNLSDNNNKEIWANLADWLPRVSGDIEVVLIETKPDKRTVTYKELKKQAQIIELVQWTDHDTTKVERWVLGEAKRLGVSLDTKCLQLFVRRVGFDQWRLLHGLEKLALTKEVTVKVIEDIIDTNPVENVFNLFEAALNGDRTKLGEMVHSLELIEDPYKLLGLLSGQAFQLAAIVMAGPGDEVAKDLGVHPYGVSKLISSARRLGRRGVRQIIKAFAEADDDMKLSKAEPWLLIERALMKVASL